MPNRILHLGAVVAIVTALLVSRQSVRGLEWPYDGDHFRDLAQAQVTLDGHPLSDPHYAGEFIWYNPLVSWVVAGGSAAWRMAPAHFHVQAGPWLNLLGPIAFYLLAVRLAGPAAAVSALVIFLFINARTEPALVYPTYSPWLFVASFAQGFFYLSVYAMSRARKHPTDRRALVVGLLAGVTFLAHTAPALVLGVMALALLPRRALAIAGAAALVVASPFLSTIVWRYHLHVVNSTPMAWQWLPVALPNLPSALRDNAAWFLMGGAGLFVVRDKIARAWIGAAALLYALALSRDLSPVVPALVPAFHFWRYLVAALTLLAGATVATGIRWACGRHHVAVLALLALAVVAWRLPTYRTRFDFVYGRAVAAGRDPSHAMLTARLRKFTPEDAVILGSRGVSLEIIGPAGRRVVAVNGNWSNPYIDNSERTRDRDAMLDALTSHDDARFVALADRHRVTHVVGVGADECAALAGPLLQLIYDFGTACTYVRRLP